jgi:hypothetical protein
MMDENQTPVARIHHGLPFYGYAASRAVQVAIVAAFVPETEKRFLD